VVKFGGSNLKDSRSAGLLYKIIKSYKTPPVIVVSAFYGVTGLLDRSLARIPEDAPAVDEVITRIGEINDCFIDGLGLPEDKQAFVRETCSEKLTELRRYLTGVNCIRQTPDFVRDIILSFGERFSSFLITQALISKGLDCEEAIPESLGLVTDGEFGNASVDICLSEESVRERLSADKTYVVPGFYGVSPSGKITLLGRGGSDYSAACIAACLGASSLDIWKDVNGFMTADPGFIRNPVRIDRLNYSEAAELSYFGAKILHPRTVEPLMDRNIPVRIFDSRNFNGRPEPLTIINAKESPTEDVIKSITFSDEFGIIRLKGPGVGIKPGVLAKVAAVLNDAGINISSVITSQIAINLLLAADDSDKAYRLISGLSLPVVKEVAVITDISLIAVVGQGMLEQHGIASRLFSAPARKGINVLLSSLGASQVVTYLIVAQTDRDEALTEIHKEFFENTS
ncbi:MAG: aspartate kinase, partial [Bacteroidetes bacterium]|nr:aspartate kinase [Bacteroidota bacterium]